MNQKSKIIKLGLICCMIFSLTGCTKYLKYDGKTVQNNTTGQSLTKNILCQPEGDTLKLYEEYNDKVEKKDQVNLSSLPKCENLTITKGKYEGIWTSIFVKPLAWFIIKIGNFVNSYGLALILATIFVRGIVWPFTKKTALQSENLKKAQPELQNLEKKYKNKQDQAEMMQKSQEMLMIYKKYHINPMSGCIFSFIQIPLFFAFYEAISRIPAIFEETFLGFQLGTSPAIAAFQNGQYYYLILIVVIAAATYYSFKLNSGASVAPEQQKQMKTMTNVMVIIMTITAFSISSGVAIYWVVSNLFTIFQNLLVKRMKKNA